MEDEKIIDAVRLLKECCGSRRYKSERCKKCILLKNDGECLFADGVAPCDWVLPTIKPKLTTDEKIILRNIDDNYKWIARDNDGELCIYKNKTIKDGAEWDCYHSLSMNMFSHLFQFVTWEDDEPYYIPYLLEEDKQ